MRVGLLSTPAYEMLPVRDGYTWGGMPGCLAKYLDRMGHEMYLFATKGSYKPKHGKLYDPIEPIAVSQKYITYKEFYELHIDNIKDAELDIMNDHCMTHPVSHPHLVRTAHQLFAEAPTSGSSLRNLGLTYTHSQWLEFYTKIPWYTIYQGVDLEEYPYYSGKRERRLVWLSRLSYFKGADRTIKIAEKAKIPVDIVGSSTKPSDNEFAQKVIDLCDKSDYATFLGPVTHGQKVKLYQKSMALILPIRLAWDNQVWWEPFGLVALEAMACGTPVIVSPNGGFLETVQHGVSGYFATTDSEFVTAVNNIHKLKKHNIFNRANEFSAQHMAENYANLFENLITQ